MAGFFMRTVSVGEVAIGGIMNKTKELHAEQGALWGWHDMRRKTADQTNSPCRVNIKGRCGRLDCCLRWAEDPARFK
jgi:hypothetical protein